MSGGIMSGGIMSGGINEWKVYAWQAAARGQQCELSGWIKIRDNIE